MHSAIHKDSCWDTSRPVASQNYLKLKIDEILRKAERISKTGETSLLCDRASALSGKTNSWVSDATSIRFSTRAHLCYCRTPYWMKSKFNLTNQHVINLMTKRDLLELFYWNIFRNTSQSWHVVCSNYWRVLHFYVWCAWTCAYCEYRSVSTERNPMMK